MNDANKITDREVFDINSVMYKCHNLAKECGWWEGERNVGELIALMHSELSEALEAARKELVDSHLTDRLGIEVEFADTIIRIFDLCGKQNLDIGGAIKDKLEYNATRADHKIENRKKLGGKKF